MRNCYPALAARLLPLAGLLLIAAPVPAAENPDGWTLRDERTVQPLKLGTPVTITNLVGDVRVRDATEPTLVVVAMVQQRRDDPRQAVVKRVEGPAGQVEATFTGDAPDNLYPPGRAPRVDLTVFVPPGSAVSITTAGGRIEAKGVEGDVIARSDTGKILVRTPGLIDASSRRGDVDVLIKKLGRGRVYRAGSDAGKVSVRLPHTGAATVRAATTGRIASDYSMSVRHVATSTHKQATIEFGTSRLGRWLWGWAARRTQVELSSEQGDLAVLAPFPELEEP